MTSHDETSRRRRTAQAMHDTAEQLEVAEAILHRSARPDRWPAVRCAVIGASASRSGAVGAQGWTIAWPLRAVRRARQPANGVPGAAVRGHPTATRVGHRHPSLIQQPPLPDTAICAPAVLNMYATRMGRLIGKDHQAAAPCTDDTSSRIHKPTVSVQRCHRDRCRMDAGAPCLLRRHPGRLGATTSWAVDRNSPALATSRETRERVTAGCVPNQWDRRDP